MNGVRMFLLIVLEIQQWTLIGGICAIITFICCPVAEWAKRGTQGFTVKLGSAGGRGFDPRPWHYSRGSFSSSQFTGLKHQPTGKVFCPEYAISSKF